MLDVEKMVVLSTAHLRSEDVERLEKMAKKNVIGAGDLIVYKAEHWFQIYIGVAGTGDASAMSDEFKDIYAWAKEHEQHFTWLKFDSAGAEIDQFPKFDW